MHIIYTLIYRYINCGPCMKKNTVRPRSARLDDWSVATQGFASPARHHLHLVLLSPAEAMGMLGCRTPGTQMAEIYGL